MAAFDFKEIPEAHIANGEQDAFELFAKDFFIEVYKFKLLSEPSRGPDGGKDILFEEIQTGNLSDNSIIWLVSCKHKAHSGDSVKPTDESNISDRLEEHKANGFIGFYSTLPSSGLNNRLDSYKSKYKIEVFNHERIEQEIINANKFELFKRYFPQSFKKWNEDIGKKAPSKLLSEFQSLTCTVCGKDLLIEENRNSSIIVFNQNNESKLIEDIYCVCKGKCDRYMTHQARIKGCVTAWDELSDFFIPTIYLKKYMALINKLYYGKGEHFSEKALTEYKSIIIAISQYVLRHQSDSEFKRALDLNQLPEWV